MPDYSARAPRVIERNKKRIRELEWEDTRRPAWIAWLGGVCFFILLTAVLLLATSDRTSKPMNINGDQLGPIDVQGQAYVAQAQETLESMRGEEPRWALLSTQQPWSAHQLADVLSGFSGRVSTLYFAPGAQDELPEPYPGRSRLDTINAVVKLWAARAQARPEDLSISSVLVYGTPEQLRALAARQAIVEVAPVGAVYGRIGIRPYDTTPERHQQVH